MRTQTWAPLQNLLHLSPPFSEFSIDQLECRIGQCENFQFYFYRWSISGFAPQSLKSLAADFGRLWNAKNCLPMAKNVTINFLSSQMFLLAINTRKQLRVSIFSNECQCNMTFLALQKICQLSWSKLIDNRHLLLCKKFQWSQIRSYVFSVQESTKLLFSKHRSSSSMPFKSLRESNFDFHFS